MAAPGCPTGALAERMRALAEQAATSQVLTALRSLAPLVEISDEDWHEIERAAADRGVAADGSILRS